MNFPEIIQTERLILRPYRPTDAEDIFECYAQDKEVARFMTWRPHQSIEETKAFVNGRMDAWTRGDDFTWAVTTEDGKLVGGIGMRIRDFKAELGYLIGRPYWGRGYATEALQAIIRCAFQQAQILRVWAVCDVGNNASARVMEKCGMEKEGVLKKWNLHPLVSDTPRDCLCYSITREGTSQPSSAEVALSARR